MVVVNLLENAQKGWIMLVEGFECVCDKFRISSLSDALTDMAALRDAALIDTLQCGTNEFGVGVGVEL